MRISDNFNKHFNELSFTQDQDMNAITLSNVTLNGILHSSCTLYNVLMTKLLWPIGDYLLQSDDTEETTSLTAFTKLKQMTLTGNANLRIKFDIKITGTCDGYGRIYVNGSPVGTTQEDNGTGYVTKSEDFSDLLSGDTIELWAMNSGTGSTEIRNFRVYASEYVRPSLVVDSV